MCNVKVEKRETVFPKSYWGNDSAYQEEYERLWNKLVPDSGCAETLHGEALRSFSRLQYDWGNNGNCNACEVTTEEEDCWDCDDGDVQCGYCGGDGEYGDDECDECGGSGQVDCDSCAGMGIIYDAIEVREVSDYYSNFMYFLSSNVPDISSNDISELEDLIKKDGGPDFDKEENQIYNRIGDKVMHFVLNTENRELLKREGANR